MTNADKAKQLTDTALEKAGEIAEKAGAKAAELTDFARERAPEVVDKVTEIAGKAIGVATAAVDKATGGRFHDYLGTTDETPDEPTVPGAAEPIPPHSPTEAVTHRPDDAG